MLLSSENRVRIQKAQFFFLLDLYYKLHQTPRLFKDFLKKKRYRSDKKFIFLDFSDRSWGVVSSLDCYEGPIRVPCSTLESALYFYCRLYIEHLIFLSSQSKRESKIMHNYINKLWAEPRCYFDPIFFTGATK